MIYWLGILPGIVGNNNRSTPISLPAWVANGVVDVVAAVDDDDDGGNYINDAVCYPGRQGNGCAPVVISNNSR